MNSGWLVQPSFIPIESSSVANGIFLISVPIGYSYTAANGMFIGLDYNPVFYPQWFNNSLGFNFVNFRLRVGFAAMTKF